MGWRWMPTQAVDVSSIARGMGHLGSSSGSAGLPSTSSCAGLSYGGSRAPDSHACSASSMTGSPPTTRSGRRKAIPTMARYLGVSSRRRASEVETFLLAGATSVPDARRNLSRQSSATCPLLCAPRTISSQRRLSLDID